MTRPLARTFLSSGTTYAARAGYGFAIDRDDAFQATMLLGLYDPLVEAVIERYVPAGGTVIDAGAHLGYFSLAFGRRVGPMGSVHAFECDPRLVPRLRRHVEINGMDWITVNARGLLDRSTDDQSLYLPEQLGWASTLEGAWGATEAATVSMVSLDEYVDESGLAPQQLSFVKLDVEGCELRALIGARETLRSASAPVLIEFLPARIRAVGDDPQDLITLFDELGYEPWSPVLRRGGELRLVPGTEPEIGEDVLFLKRS
jgi:FkbM family methyltransferase